MGDEIEIRDKVKRLEAIIVDTIIGQEKVWIIVYGLQGRINGFQTVVT